MRTVSFPVLINPDKTHVEYKHGVLSIDAEKVMQKEITKKSPKAIVKKKAKTEKIPKETMKKTKTKNKPAPKAAK